MGIGGAPVIITAIAPECKKLDAGRDGNNGHVLSCALQEMIEEHLEARAAGEHDLGVRHGCYVPRRWPEGVGRHPAAARS